MLMVRNLGSMIQQKIDDIDGDSYQDKLNHLANCNCCERHQVNKPTVFSAWVDTRFHDNRLTHRCTCNCRHVARLICRQVDDYNPPPITRSNTPISILDI